MYFIPYFSEYSIKSNGVILTPDSLDNALEILQSLLLFNSGK